MRLLLTLLVLTLLGCIPQKYFYNKNVKPNEQQMFYNQDLNYCRGVAAGTIPMPHLNLSQSQGYRTFGTAQIYSQSHGYADVRYQSETYPTGGLSVSDALQISEYLDAGTMRDEFSEACMFRLGWREIPCKTCIPGSSQQKRRQEPVFKSDQNKDQNPQDKNTGTTVFQLKQRYYWQPDNKAFALGSNNIAGAAWGAASEEEAKLLAIKTCEEFGGINCKLTSVNNTPQ